MRSIGVPRQCYEVDIIFDVPNRLLLAAARKEGIRRFITKHRLTKSVADRFVAGNTLNDGLMAVRELNNNSIGGILDYLGENVETETQADAAADAYLDSLSQIAAQGLDAHVSVKLTQLGLDLSMQGCVERLAKLCAKASEIGSVLAIDMESHEYTDQTLDAYRLVRTWNDNVVLCLQAYLRRTPADIQSLLSLTPGIRLCKGAYNEPRDIAFDRQETRKVYLELVKILIDNTPYTAVATHDDVLIREVEKFDRGRFEFQMLYGVRSQLQHQLAGQGFRVRTYIPFGDQWYPYLMRRLAERPANLRFFAEALVRG